MGTPQVQQGEVFDRQNRNSWLARPCSHMYRYLSSCSKYLLRDGTWTRLPACHDKLSPPQLMRIEYLCWHTICSMSGCLHACSYIICMQLLVSSMHTCNRLAPPSKLAGIATWFRTWMLLSSWVAMYTE